MNFSSLTFTKGSKSYGEVAYYAGKVINAPNGFIDGEYVWGEADGAKFLAYYKGDATDFTLPADCNGENYAIGTEAFRDCTGLCGELVIPNCVTRLRHLRAAPI